MNAFCSLNSSSVNAELSRSCCSTLSCCRYWPLKFALPAGDIRSADEFVLDGGVEGGSHDSSDFINTLVIAVAQPVKTSVNGCFFCVCAAADR